MSQPRGEAVDPPLAMLLGRQMLAPGWPGTGAETAGCCRPVPLDSIEGARELQVVCHVSHVCRYAGEGASSK